VTTYRAADLPARSIVADEQRGIVWMAVDDPGTDRWASRGGDEESDSVIDYALQHRGATVVRVGDGHDGRDAPTTAGAMITSTLTADRPRGKNQRERWYRDHARAAETLFVIELPNGALGKHNGAVAVSARRDVMEAVVDRLVDRLMDRSTWTVRAWTFEEGARVTRLTSFADVAAMFS
jgi:hypothetical protein